MVLRRFSVCAALFAVISSPLLAAADGGSAADFLNIDVSAREGATGSALSALADGPTASYYNPAGLTGIGSLQISGMHSEWLQDLRYEYLGAAFPAGSRGALGLSMSYLGYGDIQGYSASNVPIGNISAYDWALGLSYGRAFSQSFSLGAGIKTIGEKLDNISATGFAGDIGAQYRRGNIGAGLSIMNLGPKMKYSRASSPLPTRADAALSYSPWGSGLSLIGGMSLPFEGSAAIRTGIEYTYSGILTLRTGYDSADRIDGGGGMSFGAGFNLLGQSIDYAYNSKSLLGNTHQISFVLRFGQTRTPDSFSKIKEPQTPKENEKVGQVRSITGPGKANYLVCAGKYNTRANAETHIDALTKFGYSPKLDIAGLDEYRVVLSRVSNKSKAEKMKNDFEKKGLSCFIEEE